MIKPAMNTRRLARFMSEAAGMLAIAARSVDTNGQPMSGRALRRSLRRSLDLLTDILDEEEESK